LLDDEDAHVRQRAAWALGRIRDPAAVEPLIALLEASLAASLDPARDRTDDDDVYDDNAYLRYTVAEALGLLADPSAVEPLLRAIATDTGYSRTAEIEALGWRR
jgi:HEAT repeat protein